MKVLGYPRSGNTWFCYLLAYSLNTVYDDEDAPGVHPRDEYQRSLVKGGHAHTSRQDTLGQVLKTHRVPSAQQAQEPVIYLVRDVRDVAVSYFYYLNQQKGRNVTIEEDRKGFHEHLQKRVPEWLEHVVGGLNTNPAAIVRYEDLKLVPVDTLLGLGRRLGAPLDETLVRDTLDKFAFKTLAKRKEGQEDRNSFFRKGIAGDWVNVLTPDENAWIEQQAGQVLEVLGYKPEAVRAG